MAIFEAFEDPFWKFSLVIFISLSVYDVFKSYWVEKGLKKLENFDFFANLSQNRHFLPKNEPKGPQGPIGTPKMTKIVFLSCQDMKTPCWEKEFLSYLP